MEEKKLTGYPSIDKPWLKYYDENAFEKGNDIPRGRTIWNVMEERFELHKDYPALEYFGRKYSRPELKNMVYEWAKAFRAMDVNENDVVAIYSPFLPDICAMTFAINMIGAVAYFLKLAISPEALSEETNDSRIAVVFDGMWENVKNEFSKEKYDYVIIVSVADGMPLAKKIALKAATAIKSQAHIIKGKNIIYAEEARKMAGKYKGSLEVNYVADRDAFVTSSSGTTGGVVKGAVATNETTLTQIFMGTASKFIYKPGGRCLNNFPPTASTSLNALFFLPLYHGLTIVIDPRISEDDFYRQITEYKPSIAIATGTVWELFFNRVKKEITLGKKFDFSCSTGWVVGGEGIDSSKFIQWDAIMKDCGAFGMCSGYGSSELFSSISSDTFAALGKDNKQKGVNAVGVPCAGITVGVFDENGVELSYNKRGELWVNSQSAMKCYYNKPELTAKTKINGWIHTGDLAEIDENGFLYVWGRLTEKIDLANGQSVYLFDIANKIKEFDYINDAIVLSIATNQNKYIIVAHIVWRDEPSVEEKKRRIEELNAAINDYSQGDFEIAGYYEYKTMLPYSPTTLKKDKNKMSKQRDGFMQVINGTLQTVDFK